MTVSSAAQVRTPLGRQEQRLLDEYRARMLAAFPGQIERIVLYGSRVRGEAHGESDWDFAVFFKRAPTGTQADRLAELDWELRQRFGCEVQSLDLPSEAWLAQTELACNIRDHGLIIYGDDYVPRLGRPVLQHARDALAKAARFAGQAEQAVPEAYETVVHNSNYAMFHAARAALLAVEGSASTKHGRVVDAFKNLVKRRFRPEAARHAASLIWAYRHRITADYGNQDRPRRGGG